MLTARPPCSPFSPPSTRSGWKDVLLGTRLSSSRSFQYLVILEINNRAHAGGGIYLAAAERQKNDGNFQAGANFDKILFLRVSPTGQYMTDEGEQANLDKKARWLIVREWIVTFLRYPLGSWAFEKDRVLVYLFCSHDSSLVDVRPSEFQTIVAYQPPGLGRPASPDLVDWACSLDPYLLVKGSSLAQEHLALKNWLTIERAIA